MNEKEIKKVSDNLELIFMSIREGLIENIKNMDIVKYTHFNFEDGVLELTLPEAKMNVSLHDILKNIDKIAKNNKVAKR